jgi:hypothetical protein
VWVGDKVVVADQLNPAAERLCHKLPASVVVFGNPVFDAPDLRITIEHSLPEFDHLVRRLSALVRLFERIDAIFKQLAGGRVQEDDYVFARLVASLLNGFENQFNGLFVRLQLRGKSAFITDSGVVALLVQNRLQRMEGLSSRSQAFAIAGALLRAKS